MSVTAAPVDVIRRNNSFIKFTLYPSSIVQAVIFFFVFQRRIQQTPGDHRELCRFLSVRLVTTQLLSVLCFTSAEYHILNALNHQEESTQQQPVTSRCANTSAVGTVPSSLLEGSFISKAEVYAKLRITEQARTEMTK